MRVRWGLRPRLVVAFMAVALLGAAITTVYSNLSLTAQLKSSAKARITHSAMHFGDVAAVLSADGGWSRQSIETMHHLAQIDFLAVQVYAEDGTLVFEHPVSAPVEPGAAASAPVLVGDRQIGHVVVSRDDGQLFTAEEVQLRSQLVRENVLAGAVSVAVALAVALYLAVTLSKPLRRIRAGAEAMGAGDLEVRVPESGDAEIRAVAEALNGLAETLQQEEGLRKENVADLAHELRTPVMGLLARIEAAQDGVLDDEAANLAAMHDEALRLARLLDDLSSLAEAQRPGLLLDLEAVDLAEVARAQAAAFAPAFAEKGIAFTQDLSPAVVEGEPGRLEQILANLLSNALRYTDTGGSVSMRVAATDGRAVLDVRDTGIGIAAEDQPRVFTRFWRGEKSRSRATGGAGIGLSIVRELVSAHGGDVDVQSVPGEGSLFRVTLPLTGSAGARAGQAARAGRPAEDRRARAGPVAGGATGQRPPPVSSFAVQRESPRCHFAAPECSRWLMSKKSALVRSGAIGKSRNLTCSLRATLRTPRARARRSAARLLPTTSVFSGSCTKTGRRPRLRHARASCASARRLAALYLRNLPAREPCQCETRASLACGVLGGRPS